MRDKIVNYPKNENKIKSGYLLNYPHRYNEDITSDIKGIYNVLNEQTNGKYIC